MQVFNDWCLLKPNRALNMNEIILLLTKCLLTLFVIILVPTYWKAYGLENFLWLSDVGLFLTTIGLWLNSSLLISIAILLTLPLDIIWIVDFLFHLITGKNLLGVVGYMFDPKFSRWTRSLSLFHIFLPIIWIWCLTMWGYDENAFLYASVLVWVVLIATYFFTDPQKNINWAHLPTALKWKRIPTSLWLIMLLVAFPLIVIWPMQVVLKRIFS